MSVCYHVFCHRAQQCAHKIYRRLQRDISKSKNGVFFNNASVIASFAYRESHRRYYRDLELIPSTALPQGYKVVQKPNRALNATWNTGIQANAMQRAISFSVMGQYILRFFPYTFQFLKRGGVQRKTHVLTRTSYCIRIRV